MPLAAREMTSSSSSRQRSFLRSAAARLRCGSLASFRPLLDGSTDWPAVLNAFGRVGYKGYLTFEYFHPFAHYPEALIYNTSDALDRMLGKKA